MCIFSATYLHVAHKWNVNSQPSYIRNISFLVLNMCISQYKQYVVYGERSYDGKNSLTNDFKKLLIIFSIIRSPHV